MPPRDHKGRNSRVHRRACNWCGVGFLASRPDAKTCSTPHRQALARWVKKFGRYPKYPPASSHGIASVGGFKCQRLK